MGARFHDYFSNLAEAYRRYRPSYPPELYRWLAEQAPGRSVAIDCGAGNGQAAAGISHYFEQVIAVEASEQQAGCSLPVAGVTFHIAQAEDTGLAAGRADLVMAAQALHWFDPDAFFREADRLLKPGGLLACWCYLRLEVDPAIDAAIDRLYRETLASYWPAERHHVEQEYREFSLPWPELEHPEFTMRAMWTLDELLGYLETWSAARRYFDATGRHATEEIADEVVARWGDAVRREVRWPVTMLACRKPA